jgi:DNA-binding GntR family transcriptional regulator
MIPAPNRPESLKTVVRERILAGRYRPGEWIREAELQREFGCSNGPVREALQAAVADGIAERAAFRGVRVIDLSDAEIVALFEVRSALLGFAAELAARRAGPETARSGALLKAVLSEQSDETGATARWLSGDLSRWVFDLAGNARLREAYERPLLQSLLYVAAARKHGGVETDALLTYAFDVIEAIVAQRPTRARNAVRRLTEQTLWHLQQQKEPTR